MEPLKERFRKKAFQTGGLESNEVRKIAWPILLDIDDNFKATLHEWESIRIHCYFDQIMLDVNRMKGLMPKYLDENEEVELKNRLTTIIVSLLIDDQELHYYQGFHDICFIFFWILEDDLLAFKCLKKLAQNQLRIFMKETMEESEKYLFHIYILLYLENKGLLRKIEDTTVQTSFALAWVITWFTHVLPRIDSIVRLYDLFLADESSFMPIYSSVAIMLLSIEEVEGNMSDFGELYHCLTHLPKRHDVNKIVERTLKIQLNYPVAKLLITAEKYLPQFVKNRKRNCQTRITKGGTLEWWYIRLNINICSHPYVSSFIFVASLAISIPILTYAFRSFRQVI